MQNPIIQILDLLTNPPGNLVYHLVLSFAIITGLQFVLPKASDPERQVITRRMRLGFGILLAGQLLLFVSTALVWQGLINPLVILPPLDRAVMAIGLIWVFWLWCFPTPSKAADIIATMATAAVIIAFIFTLTAWNLEYTGNTFNNGWLDMAWQIFGLVLGLIGLALLLIKRPQAWEVGLAVAVINIAGAAAHLALGSPNANFAGFVRLAQLCSYPLLPSLAVRLFSATKEVSEPMVISPAVIEENLKTETVRRRTTADTRTVQAFLNLANETAPDQLAPALARAMAHTMISDLCLIVAAPDPFGQVSIQCGYDLIREEAIAGSVLDQKSLPNLASALARGKSIRLIPASGNTPPDLEIISRTLGLHEACPLMSVPLMLKNQPWGGVLLLSPYTNRAWTTEDQSILSSNSEAISQVLNRALTAGHGQVTENQLRQQLQDAREQFEQLQQEYQRLLNGNTLETQPQDDTLMLQLNERQTTIQQLEIEKRQLLETIAVLNDQNQVIPEAQMEQELRVTLEQVAHLQNSLAEANIKILDLTHQLQASGQLNNEERDIINSIVQELRQPLSSILGYSDLLLGESVGILGALQRKFLERVKNSSERMRSLLDDLLLYTTMQTQRADVLPEAVELSAMIDTAVNEVSPKLREKNINLRVDMPEELPQMYTDQDALQQIIIYLLQNAGTVTPSEGDIDFSVKVADNQDQPYLMLQVTDSGGGIDPDEITRVFSRRYRAENPVIQGVGDNGVGLAVAKTLVEAHNGRIWVESVPGTSSTFSVLLPIEPRLN